MMTAGGVESTGNPTDVAIQGDGFLRVATGNVATTPPTFDADPVHPGRRPDDQRRTAT